MPLSATSVTDSRSRSRTLPVSVTVGSAGPPGTRSLGDSPPAKLTAATGTGRGRTGSDSHPTRGHGPCAHPSPGLDSESEAPLSRVGGPGGPGRQPQWQRRAGQGRCVLDCPGQFGSRGWRAPSPTRDSALSLRLPLAVRLTPSPSHRDGRSRPRAAEPGSRTSGPLAMAVTVAAWWPSGCSNSA